MDERRCTVCGEAVTGREGAIYCSDRCRLRALRARRRGAQIPAVSVSGGGSPGYRAVTDNPPPALPAARPSVSLEEVARKYPIPDDLTIPKWLRRVPDAPHWKDYDKD